MYYIHNMNSWQIISLKKKFRSSFINPQKTSPKDNNMELFLFNRAATYCNTAMLYISHQFLQFPLIKYILTHKVLPLHQLSADARVCHLNINYHIKMAA